MSQANLPRISLTQAKINFYELTERVVKGERIVITKWGKPVSILEKITIKPNRYKSTA